MSMYGDLFEAGANALWKGLKFWVPVLVGSLLLIGVGIGYLIFS